jgi:hypothetical protein
MDIKFLLTAIMVIIIAVVPYAGKVKVGDQRNDEIGRASCRERV